MTTAYSSKPLIEKLEIKAGMMIAVINAPDGYLRQLAADLPNDVTVSTVVSVPSRSDRTIRFYDFIHVFASERADLEVRFPVLIEALSVSGMLWISWRKQAARVPTNLTEDVVRAVGLANRVVDVKVAAIDETWSGLKFVRRLKDRR